MAEPATTGPLAVLAQASALWAKQPKGRKLIAIAVVAVVALGVGYATLFKHGDQWVGFADTASPSDTSEIYALLQARDIPARLSATGKVEVTSDRVVEARSIAAGEGLPHMNQGFATFDTVNLGMSSFDEQVQFRRALEGELSNNIQSMAQVQSARVLISFGKTSMIKDQEVAPSASVALRLHPGQNLTSQQVQGMRQLVAKSVQNLKADEVVLVDQNGNLLDAADSSGGEHRADIERAVTLHVRTLLERIVGEGKVSVVATADFDTSKTNETEETFDKDNPVVRSESRQVEGAQAANAATSGIGGVAGTQGNLPGATPAAPVTGAGNGSGKLTETKNYEISRKVRQTEGQTGVLKRLHVAIVVDDKLVAGKHVARTEAELKQLTTIARTAAGFDEARGDSLELASIAFAGPDDTMTAPIIAGDWTEQLPLPMPIMAAAAGGVVLLLIAVAFVLLVRRSRRKARREAAAAMPIALPAPLAELEHALEARPPVSALAAAAVAPEHALPAGPPVQERVLAAVRSDVERAAAVLTSWLAEPPPKGAKP